MLKLKIEGLKVDWKDRWINGREHRSRMHGKLLQTLAVQGPKKVNNIAEKLHHEVFSEVDCMDCANCCKSIPPLLNDTDIKRISKSLGMNAGEFKVKYVVFDDDGDMVINTSPCPFLEEDNACSIYEIRPKACRQYPHTDNHQFAKHFELHKVNAKYCPAVFHILERFAAI